MEQLQKLVDDFAREAKQPIFLIDRSLTEAFDNDDQGLITYIMRTVGYTGTKLEDKALRTHFFNFIISTQTHNYGASPDNYNGYRMFGYHEEENIPPLSRLLKKTVYTKLDENNLFDATDEDWRDFNLYHELFHFLDETVSTEGPDDDAQEHYHEFFADFAACLYMASKGKNMFLNVAKIRAIDMHAKGLEGTFGMHATGYANHHIYGIFRKEKIDTDNLSIADIVDITKDMARKYAFDNNQLKNLYNYMERLTPDNSKNRLKRIRENNPTNNFIKFKKRTAFNK